MSSAIELVGWERLRHGGLLLDPPRLREVAAYAPAPLLAHEERELRRLLAGVLDDGAGAGDFISTVLEKICGFARDTGSWHRGTQVGAEWNRRAITGESVKPRHLWLGPHGAVLPVFIVDADARLGIGRGRKAASQVVAWLRAGSERLALITNGRQWRLTFAGLDFDAWCEWDADLWLEEGALSPQVPALRSILTPRLWIPAGAEGPSPLLQAILDSRKGQAELSAVLGERVREAVELLVHAHGEALKEQCAGVDPADIYRAAVRMVMRMVVVLFAESRELLPRDNALYHGSYSLAGLLEELEKVAARGGNRLARSWNAWPRVLALFRLVYDGSHHPALPVPAYGGELFATGDASSPDGLGRALAVFETAAFEQELLSDREVHRMLERITRTKVKVRQGRASTWVPTPVDFSDLSSEYIGILYEGLLDFELKTAPSGDPIVFLAVGNQPALPLSRLEAMDEKALADLLEKMKDASKTEADEGQESEGEEADDEAQIDDIASHGLDEDEDEIATAASEAAEAAARDDGDERHTTRTRAESWARRAVEVGKLARRPKGTLTPEKRLAYEDAVGRKARQLVIRVVLPGEWYLVRWGGTRKGSGTFYTRPGLAVPTVHRTLRPLAYSPPQTAGGDPDRDAPAAEWIPRPPEEILALKVCDPACGSGTFPVAALRFLTEALYASLHHHGRIAADGERAVVRLLGAAAGSRSSPDEQLGQELLPCRPDDAMFEPRLKAILRRHVVERCIYGVDIDPLAVELCRLALWVETMDRTLPFSFLDHKVKFGNSLIGAWFDQFQHYPVMAWKNREAGDKTHGNGVHFKKESRTKAIKDFVKNQLIPDLRRLLAGRTLFDEDFQVRAAAVHDGALETLVRLHALPVQDSAERARLYRDELVGAPAYLSLKAAMDLWCASWFWPAAELDHAPLPTTLTLPSQKTLEIAKRIAASRRFFHWELEFPDVFQTAGAGFDAMLGNPPWDIAKPSSKEFFSNIDPLYRAYGKQEALRYQTAYFADEYTERRWLDYNEAFRAQSNFVANSANPFGDPKASDTGETRFVITNGEAGTALHDRWRASRARSRGFADPSHPFRLQGSSDVNLYKLFLEQTHALLRPAGRIGFIVPFGLCCDDGCSVLRRTFIDRCRWEWLFGFENREGIFAIDPRNKFNPIIIEKGAQTSQIRTAFMRRKLDDWERAEAFVTTYSRTQVERFSRRTHAILEIQSSRDLQLLEKLYANSVLLSDDGPSSWGIQYASEFHMTNDSKLFPSRQAWEADGYRPDEYSRWLRAAWHERSSESPAPITRARADIDAGIVLSADGRHWTTDAEIELREFPEAKGSKTVSGLALALPLYQGPMVFDNSPNAAGYRRGGNSGAVWLRTTDPSVPIEPQYLMALSTFQSSDALKSPKVAYRTLSNPMSNERSAIPAFLQAYPCGNSLGVLWPQPHTLKTTLVLSALLGSFVFDWLLRLRLSSMNINVFYLKETCIPRLSEELTEALAYQSARLSLPGYRYSVEWLRFPDVDSPARSFALTEHERLRIRVSVAAVAYALWGLSADDLPQLLEQCDLPVSVSTRRDAVRNISSKGLWRVGRDQDPELRATVLSISAMHDLESKIRSNGNVLIDGVRAFLEQNDGDGWMLPETLRLADYGIGQDERAKKHQPVASRLGPRFYDWQLAQSAEESWRECHLHSRNLLGEAGYRRLLSEIESGVDREQPTAVAKQPVPSKKPIPQGTLFD